LHLASAEQLNWKGQRIERENSRTGAHLIEKINSGQRAQIQVGKRMRQRFLEIGFKGVCQQICMELATHRTFVQDTQNTQDIQLWKRPTSLNDEFVNVDECYRSELLSVCYYSLYSSSI